MERPLDAGAVVVAESADVVDDVLDVGFGDLAFEQGHLAVGGARLRPAPQIHHDLDEVRRIRQGMHRLHHIGREGREKQIQIVDQLPPAVPALISHVFSCAFGLAYSRNERRFGDADDGLFHQ